MNRYITASRVGAFRVFLLFVGITLAGIFLGALAGGISGLIIGVLMGGISQMSVMLAFLCAMFGGLLGMFCAPFAAFVLVPHAPLWRVIVYAMAGTILGSLPFALLRLNPGLALMSALIGFFMGIARLVPETDTTQPQVAPPAGKSGISAP